MALDTNKQQRKAHLPKIVFHAAISAALLSGTWYLAFATAYPAFDAASESVAAKMADLKDLENGNLPNFDKLSKLLGDAMPQYLSSKKDEAMALVAPLKDANGGFLKKLEAANADIEKQKDDIAKQKEVLGNIVPTLTSSSSDEAFERDVPSKVDLKRLVQYMEDQFFRTMGVPDGNAVGLDGIRFDAVDREPYKIGTFSMSVPYKDVATLRSMLDLFARTGVVPMLPEGGIDVSKAPSSSRIRGNVPAGYSAMTNPLITVDQLSVNNYLDPSKRDQVAGNATVRFYVRTLNYDETQVLSNSLGALISGAKDDPTAPGIVKSVSSCLAQQESAAKAACEGAKRATAACPLNDVAFVEDLSELRDLNKSAAGMPQAVANIVAKKSGKSDVETAAALSDAYRRVNAMDKRSKDLCSDLSAKLGLK